jgi:hypothetical protein
MTTYRSFFLTLTLSTFFLFANARLAIRARLFPRRSLSKEEIAVFRRDGVVLVKGILNDEEVKEAQAEAMKILNETARTFPAYRLINFQGWRQSRGLRKVAMDSSLPYIAAQALGLTESRGGTRKLRLLKDALLAFKSGDAGCDWHTDDKFFWPTEDVPAGSLLEGCNVWIALTPVRASDGGGLAVAPGSFTAPWREEAQAAIAFAPGSIPTTCDIAKRSPKNRARLENLKLLHDMEPGDAIVHARYCFHRGEPFRDGANDPLRIAYSVRYEPEVAHIVDNKFERAIRARKVAGGDELRRAGAFYPRVWPRSDLRERLVIRLGSIKPDT